MERPDAMLISKFNKLIHNKFIWAAFAILVSLAMVGLFTPAARGRGGQADNSVGTLFGKPVERAEWMRARLYVQAFQPTSGGVAEQQRVDDEAWRRLAIRRYAAMLGISVSNQELTETIARDPSFAVSGVFSRQRYQQLVEGQIGVPVGVFEDYLRDELLQQKMQATVGTSLWIAPHELTQSVSRFTDRFTLDVVTLSTSNLLSEITVTDEQVRDFYDQNPALFNAPELRSVLYVEWPVADLAKSVNVPEQQIQDAYDRDIERYSITDTNTMTVSYTPFADVADELRETIATREALSMAGEYALQFLDDLSMIDYGDPVSIHSVAKTYDMTVHTSAFFSATSPVPGIKTGNEFNRAAFELDPAETTRSYSRTIIGDDAVYVLAWHTNRPAFLQPFEDVKETAIELTTEQARRKAYRARVDEIHSKLLATTTAETDFSAAAAALDLDVQTVGPFSVYNADPEEIPFFADIAPSVLPLQTGDTTDPITSAGDDTTLIVYLAERVPGDPAEAEALKPDLIRMLKSSRMRMHVSAWADALLAAAREHAGSDKNVGN